MSLASSLTPRRGLLAAAAPGLFVLLWSTGFIGAGFGMPHAEPFIFLALRLAAAATLTFAIAVISRAPWPASAAAYGHIVVAGLLIHGVYLGGVFAALHRGMPAGIAALIVGAQPLLTAMLAWPLLRERVTRRQWLGLAVGFAGLALVVTRTLRFERAGLVELAFAVAALFGITLGTLYQKRYCAGLDLRSGVAIQYSAAGLLALGASLLVERQHVEWVGEFLFALGWLVVVLSLGATTLLYLLIRRGAAARVASLFYLVPPVTALMAYAAFGERLGPLAILGMALAGLGVALVNR